MTARAELDGQELEYQDGRWVEPRSITLTLVADRTWWKPWTWFRKPPTLTCNAHVTNFQPIGKDEDGNVMACIETGGRTFEVRGEVMSEEVSEEEKTAFRDRWRNAARPKVLTTKPDTP